MYHNVRCVEKQLCSVKKTEQYESPIKYLGSNQQIKKEKEIKITVVF